MSDTTTLGTNWELSSDAIWATTPWNARVRIATLSTFSPMNGIDHQKIGRLMSAAPDLLEALKYALENLEGIAAGQDISSIVLREIARAAIAKAEGRNA